MMYSGEKYVDTYRYDVCFGNHIMPEMAARTPPIPLAGQENPDQIRLFARGSCLIIFVLELSFLVNYENCHYWGEWLYW